MSFKISLPKINVGIKKSSKAEAAPVVQADVDINVGRGVHADVDIHAERAIDVHPGRGVDINVGRSVHADVDINAGRGVDINVGRSVHADVDINAGRGVDINVGRSVHADVDINAGRGVDINVGRSVHADVDINAGRGVDINVGRSVHAEVDIHATGYRNISRANNKVAAEGSRINIFVSCNKLKGKDKDPVVLMYILAGDQWQEVGRTEAQKNTANPEFTKPIEVEYFFEEVQRVRFDVYDVDSKTTSVTDEDHLGFAETTLGEIVSSASHTRQLLLDDKTLDGTITLRAEDQSKEEQTIQMAFSGQKLAKKDFIGKTDGFLTFSRQTNDGEWRCVLKTEVVKNSQNPSWRPLRVKASQLCANNNDAIIRVECWDWDSNGKNDLVGSFNTTLGELIRDGPGKQWPAINPKKAAKKKDYTNSGIITLTSFQVNRGASFTDYLRAGLAMGVTVAIDFTGSNGRVTSPESLHYIGGSEPNAYMKAIESVVGVVQEYDSDKVFPTYGFGAKIPPNKEISHGFPLNFATGSPNCIGVQGVLDAYKASLSEIELFGPTNFAPIINHVAKFAAAIQLERSARHYFVLLILTDGIITDLPDTIREIVAASHLPMSIVIVGIGGSDFEAIKVLDGDVQDSVGGVKSRRDIVQFVAYRDCETPAVLAKQVLAEIPRQVFEYFSINGIQPGAGVQRK